MRNFVAKAPQKTLSLFIGAFVVAASSWAGNKVSNGASNALNDSPAGFQETLSLQGLTFKLSSPNDQSINNLTIEAKGLKQKAEPIRREIDGTISGAEVADLNVDGFPEVYVYATSAGSGSYGSVVAFSSNKNKSLSEIYVTPIEKVKKASKGYMGHDEFSVVESTLVRRFPVYRQGDINAKATGGMRQIHYKLKAGEAGWVLVPARVEEY